MEEFRRHLQREFVRRTAKNPSYSLRAYANHLKVHHATLSTLLSGKRKITPGTIAKLGPALGLGPHEIERLRETTSAETSPAYAQLQEDTFTLMSEWYFDAILELSLIEQIQLEAKTIARVLRLPLVQAQTALDVLERLGFLLKEDGRAAMRHAHTTTILDEEFTSAANRRYQRQSLEKSIEAVEEVDPAKRNHTSITMAVDTRDLPELKKKITRFRRELNAFAQRPGAKPDEVYQVQISLFPLSRISSTKGEK